MKPKLFVKILSALIILLIVVYFVVDPETHELNDATRKHVGHKYLSLSDGVTHYKFDGPENGNLVVLVHGGTVPQWAWDEQIKALSKAGFRVLSYDKYGRGYSDRPDLVYNQELYQRQLLELIEKLNISKPFDLIGASLGGATAINFVSRYPDKIKKLILIAPVINNYKVPLAFQLPIIGEILARFSGIKILTERFNSLYESSPRLNHYSKLYKEQTTYKGFQRSLLSMLRNDALGNYNNAYDIVGKQKREILLVWGTDDTEITEEMIKDIRSFIPEIKFVPVENTGHGILFQKSDKVNKLIISFL